MTGTTAGLVLGVTGAVVVACAAGAYVVSIHRLRAQLESARETTLAEGHLVRAAIEHQMEEKDRSLIERMIGSFGREPGVESLMLLDREGRVRYSSMPIPAGGAPTIDSPTCQACHRFPPGQRAGSHLIEMPGANLLRTVMPLRNLEQCHRCHNQLDGFDGVLVVDFNAGPMRAALKRDLRWMVVVSSATALLLVGVIAASVRFFIMRRLRRFESTARMITAAGDLERRVPMNGADTIAWLAREFNSMADSLGNLVAQVESQGERLETVINSIDDGIVVLDADRKVMTANEAFLRRTGRLRPGVLGAPCLDSAGGMCSADDCLAQSCTRTSERQVRIHERRTILGEAAWEEVHASPVLGSDGRVLYVVEVWRDISGRRAAEARLAESHRLASLGLLAAGFSHELNTPLATTLACVEDPPRLAARPEGSRRLGSRRREGRHGARAASALPGRYEELPSAVQRQGTARQHRGSGADAG